jgi:hypothetical protein
MDILEQLIPLFAIGVGLALGVANMIFITKLLRRSFSPKWNEAEAMRQILRKQFGVRSTIVSVDAVGIVRLRIHGKVPVHERINEFKAALQRDIRVETDKTLPVLAVLPPDRGIRKPATVAPRALPVPTPI